MIHCSIDILLGKKLTSLRACRNCAYIDSMDVGYRTIHQLLLCVGTHDPSGVVHIIQKQNAHPFLCPYSIIHPVSINYIRLGGNIVQLSYGCFKLVSELVLLKKGTLTHSNPYLFRKTVYNILILFTAMPYSLPIRLVGFDPWMSSDYQ